MTYLCLIGFFIITCKVVLSAQTNRTANDFVPPYQDEFGFGSNMGYYPPWRDEDLATIAAGDIQKNVAGVGVNALRPALFEYFLEYYGYDFRVPTFKYYDSIGIKNNTVFIGYPNDAHRDRHEYCPSKRSELFANLYTPIWDNGENGTPVNDTNYYALYVYKALKNYMPYVKFWEIWNEPDFDQMGNGWKPPTLEGNWWHNTPQPCEIAISAPIYHYIRLLRISYEVIKTIDPNAYVAIGGLGYPSFLDAVMRNTDNPNNGTVTAAYPNKGGAYFDVLSFHSYPHIDGSMRKWSDAIGGFVYKRHSDEGVKGMITRKDEFKTVLEKYGYNNINLPSKHFILTETSYPSKSFGEYYGSPEGQRNYAIKSIIASQKNDILHSYFYSLSELKTTQTATNEYDLMGFYKRIENTQPYTATMTEAGIGYKTAASLLAEYRFNPQKTEALNLPVNLDGAAFTKSNGEDLFVLWAKTHTDKQEFAEANYSFPTNLPFRQLERFEWDYSKTSAKNIQDAQNVKLLSAPTFLKPIPLPQITQDGILNIYPNPVRNELFISYNLLKKNVAILTVNDTVGKIVKVLVAKQIKPAGDYSLRWDVTDVVPGIYFLRLQLGDEIYTKKFIVMDK